MEFKAEVSFSGLEKALEELGPKLAKKTLRKAGNKVGDFWIGEMKSRVPVDKGDLRDSIASKVTTRKSKKGGVMKVSVGPAFGTIERQAGDATQQPAVYGMFVEFGTEKMKREPYARPTFDETAQKAVDILVKSLQDDLIDVVKG